MKTIKLRSLAFTVFSLLFFLANAQEQNTGKKLGAKSILNEKVTIIEVEEWLSEKPDTQGKFIMIDFWATWCGPCLALIPKLNEWHKKYADKLTIIGISDEPAQKVKSNDKIKIDYFSAIDTEANFKKQLEVKGIPHCIIIDPKGIVRWEGFPFLKGHELTPEVLEGLLEKYH